MKIDYDKDSCYKCSGQGNIRRYSGIAGGTCFRCSGAGFTLTKAGKRAAAFVAAEREKRLGVKASEVKVGDRIHVPRQFAGHGPMGGQFITFRGAREVKATNVRKDSAWSHNGVPQETYTYDITVSHVGPNPGFWVNYDPTAKTIRFSVSPNTVLYRPWTNEILADVWASIPKGRDGKVGAVLVTNEPAKA